jgi:hypothetical protein
MSPAYTEIPPCQSCEQKLATCFGIYEVNFDEPPTFCCDDCCGHGGEDGWCKPIAEYDAWMDATFKELASLREQVPTLINELRVTDELLVERSRLLALSQCPQHGDCVPFAMDEVTRLRAEVARLRAGKAE